MNHPSSQSRSNRSAGACAGFTLVELLLATAISAVIITAVGGGLTASQQQWMQQRDRILLQREAGALFNLLHDDLQRLRLRPDRQQCLVVRDGDDGFELGLLAVRRPPGEGRGNVALLRWRLQPAASPAIHRRLMREVLAPETTWERVLDRDALLADAAPEFDHGGIDERLSDRVWSLSARWHYLDAGGQRRWTDPGDDLAAGRLLAIGQAEPTPGRLLAVELRLSLLTAVGSELAADGHDFDLSRRHVLEFVRRIDLDQH